jgi:hypothetical protein
MIILVLVVFATIFPFVTEILKFSQNLGEPVNGFGILPHLINNSFFRYAIQFGVILLFCNAPFVTPNSSFIIIRAGYKKWFSGQILYVFISSFIYTIFIFISTLIIALPNLTFEQSWGKVFSTLTQNLSHDVPYYFGYGIHLNYSAFDAFFHTSLLLFLFSFMLGLLIFFLNSFINKSSGMIAATVIILFSFAAEWGPWKPSAVVRISPSSLTNLSSLDNKGVSEFPTLGYAYSVLLLLCAMFVVLIFTVILCKIKPYKKFKENMGGWSND